MQANRAHMVTYFGYFDSPGAAKKQFCDYQGNIRTTITANSNAKVQTTDDYPYDLSMATSTGAAANTILYIDPSDETIIAYEGNKRIWFGLRNGGIVVTDDDVNKIDPKLHACFWENQLRSELNKPIRIGYGITNISGTYYTQTLLPIYASFMPYLMVKQLLNN